MLLYLRSASSFSVLPSFKYAHHVQTSRIFAQVYQDYRQLLRSVYAVCFAFGLIGRVIVWFASFNAFPVISVEGGNPDHGIYIVFDYVIFLYLALQ